MNASELRRIAIRANAGKVMISKLEVEMKAKAEEGFFKLCSDMKMDGESQAKYSATLYKYAEDNDLILRIVPLEGASSGLYMITISWEKEGQPV